jgi:hypothetical protein
VLFRSGLKCVIDKYANTISVTANLIDYKQYTTTFYGKDISFTTPYSVYTTMMGSTGVVPPQAIK